MFSWEKCQNVFSILTIIKKICLSKYQTHKYNFNNIIIIILDFYTFLKKKKQNFKIISELSLNMNNFPEK